MTTFQRAVLALAVAALLLFAWLGRYSLVAAGTAEYVRTFMLDRWTGEVYFPRLSDTPTPRQMPSKDGP